MDSLPLPHGGIKIHPADGTPIFWPDLVLSILIWSYLFSLLSQPVLPDLVSRPRPWPWLCLLDVTFKSPLFPCALINSPGLGPLAPLAHLWALIWILPGLSCPAAMDTGFGDGVRACVCVCTYGRWWLWCTYAYYPGYITCDDQAGLKCHHLPFEPFSYTTKKPYS